MASGTGMPPASFMHPKAMPEETDVVGLFQSPGGWEQHWADLIEQLAQWFEEGRATPAAPRQNFNVGILLARRRRAQPGPRLVKCTTPPRHARFTSTGTVWG